MECGSNPLARYRIGRESLNVKVKRHVPEVKDLRDMRLQVLFYLLVSF